VNRAEILAILICLTGTRIALGDDSLRRAEVAAANADAQDSLRQEILATEIDRGITINDILVSCGGPGVLQQAVAAAEQIGGTRWIDDQTCQLQLDVSGIVVEQLLLKVTADHPDHLLLPLDRLKARLKPLERRSFTGAGTSTALVAAEQLRPSDQQVGWTAVRDEDRHAAIEVARQNAAAHVVDSLRPISMPDGKSLGDALEQPAVSMAVNGWLADRPITAVEFRDDLEVRLTIAVNEGDLWQVIHDALLKQKAVKLPSGKDGWKRLEEQVERRAGIPIGRSIAKSSGVVPAAAPVMLPPEPPDWANQSMEAEGTSPYAGGLLKTARVAEGLADEKLAAKINDLPLTPKLKLGQAAASDSRLAEAVSRALGRAKAYKVDYNFPEAGAARVKVEIDLADLWQELLNR
jgi:hypothetical protein